MKAPLRPFEYMAWAKTVPRGARYDLAASGMADAFESDSPALSQPWDDVLSVAAQCRRADAEAALEAFIESVARRYDVDPKQVTPSLGASQSIMQVLIALIRAGDHVIVERPTYEPLHRAPEILGARVSRLERRFDEDWAVVPERLAQLITPRTRAVILSNLHNPSGVAISRDALTAVAGLADRVGALVLVDEVYLDYDFAGLTPACLAASNAVSWSSTTKAFGFSSLRAGWIVSADLGAAEAIRAAGDYLHVYQPVASLELGTRVLADAPSLLRRAEQASRAGLATVEQWLASESRVSWVRPSAGISGFVRLPPLLDDRAFCEHLRERYETQVVPGRMFEAQGYVRMSFGIDVEDLKAALANFSAALTDLC